MRYFVSTGFPCVTSAKHAVDTLMDGEKEFMDTDVLNSLIFVQSDTLITYFSASKIYCDF